MASYLKSLYCYLFPDINLSEDDVNKMIICIKNNDYNYNYTHDDYLMLIKYLYKFIDNISDKSFGYYDLFKIALDDIITFVDNMKEYGNGHTYHYNYYLVYNMYEYLDDTKLLYYMSKLLQQICVDNRHMFCGLTTKQNWSQQVKNAFQIFELRVPHIYWEVNFYEEQYEFIIHLLFLMDRNYIYNNSSIVIDLLPVISNNKVYYFTHISLDNSGVNFYITSDNLNKLINGQSKNIHFIKFKNDKFKNLH